MPALPVIAIALSLATATVGAVAAHNAGKAGEDMANYNAQLADIKAKDARQRGADEGAEEMDRARRFAARQRAIMAEGGGDVDSGSNLDLLVETSGLGKINQLKIVNNAEREAWGYEIDKELELYRGKVARSNAKFGMTSSILGGLGSAAGIYGRLSTSVGSPTTITDRADRG